MGKMELGVILVSLDSLVVIGWTKQFIKPRRQIEQPFGNRKLKKKKRSRKQDQNGTKDDEVIRPK